MFGINIVCVCVCFRPSLSACLRHSKGKSNPKPSSPPLTPPLMRMASRLQRTGKAVCVCVCACLCVSVYVCVTGVCVHRASFTLQVIISKMAGVCVCVGIHGEVFLVLMTRTALTGSVWRRKVAQRWGIVPAPEGLANQKRIQAVRLGLSVGPAPSRTLSLNRVAVVGEGPSASPRPPLPDPPPWDPLASQSQRSKRPITGRTTATEGPLGTAVGIMSNFLLPCPLSVCHTHTHTLFHTCRSFTHIHTCRC